MTDNDQVSHPHKTTNKIILQHALNFSHHPAYIQHAITVAPKTITNIFSKQIIYWIFLDIW